MKEKNSYLLVSAGGRAQIMLWKIRNDDNLSCEELATFILSFDEKKRKKRCKEKQEIEFDPQTRLMDVSLCCSQSSYEFEKYLIATACSDSYFRVYTFDVNIKELSICYSVQLGEHCIFTLSEIRITEASNDNLLFVTGAADGKIKIMNHKNYIRLCDNQKKMQNLVSKSDQVFHLTLHQSGINAIDLKQITENMWFVCCGGDDNALSAVLVQFNEISGDDPSIEVIAETHICNAHASQITGIKIIGNR
ncbi:WD repeat-containing protein 6, partial [Stegodyphus mimosarum]